MQSYGQYCPISRSAQLLGDRWTIHIVRDLLTGTSRYNELARGNPGLSRSLLSRRLRQLQMAGIVDRSADGSYQLTPSGRDLEPVVFGLATWGARWAFGEPLEEELDPDLLLWWLHRQLDTSEFDMARFTVHVSFTDHRKHYWIVVEDEASLCLADPGFEVDLVVRSSLADLYQTYLGRTSLAAAAREGSVTLDGSRTSVQVFLRSFRQSPVGEIVEREKRPDELDGSAAPMPVSQVGDIGSRDLT
jgi:DNA-binding HxlR family transcriptional regulator